MGGGGPQPPSGPSGGGWVGIYYNLTSYTVDSDAAVSALDSVSLAEGARLWSHGVTHTVVWHSCFPPPVASFVMTLYLVSSSANGGPFASCLLWKLRFWCCDTGPGICAPTMSPCPSLPSLSLSLPPLSLSLSLSLSLCVCVCVCVCFDIPSHWSPIHCQECVCIYVSIQLLHRYERSLLQPQAAFEAC